MSWIKNNEWLEPASDHRIRWDSLRRFAVHYSDHRRELIGAVLVAFAGAVSAFLIPIVFRRVQEGVVARDASLLVSGLVVFLAIALVEVAATAYIRTVTARISTRMNRRLVLSYYEKILASDVEAFIAFKRRTNLFQRIIDAMSITRQTTQVIVLGSQKITVVLVVGAVIGLVSPLVLAVLSVGSTVLFVHVLFQARRLRVLRQQALAINYPLVGKMTEVISGLFTIKALAARVGATSDIEDLVKRKTRADYRELAGEVRSDQIGQAIRSVTLVAATGVSFLAMMRGSLLVADVFSLYILTQILLQPVSELAIYCQLISRLSVNVSKFYEVIDLEDESAEPRSVATPANDDRARPWIAAAPGNGGSGPVPRPRGGGGHIVMRGVEFAYRGGSPVLEGVDLEIRPGEKVSLIGRSGVGKTTLFRLLLGFLRPQRGSIHIDGREIGSFGDRNEYRKRFGVVSQQDFLFGTTIRENLRFGLNGEVDDDDLEEAVRMVGLWASLRRLEQGLDAVYSDDLLSGGQKQRLFIARAALRKPRVVLLDEPTSALDFDSERQVMAAIDRLVAETTCITIAHRLSTVRRADRVVVLADGRVQASGSHEELYRTDSYYKSLCDYNSFMI